MKKLLAVALIATFLIFTVAHAKEPWEMEVVCTAYCACEKCCGKWADGYTATGTKARPGVVAVDPEVIPLGSKVVIEGLGTFLAEDTGSVIKGNKIDVFIPDHEEARQFGVKKSNAKIYSDKNAKFTLKLPWVSIEIF